MKVLILLGLLSVGCTDARRAKLFSFGDSRAIECYSGGKLIYKGVSTGKISSEESSDGYYFTERGSDKLIEVSGNCILKEK